MTRVEIQAAMKGGTILVHPVGQLEELVRVVGVRYGFWGWMRRDTILEIEVIRTGKHYEVLGDGLRLPTPEELLTL